MKKNSIFFIIFTLAFTSLIYSEDIYFYSKTSFKNAQFWEKQYNRYAHSDTWNLYSNFFIGSIGAGVDWVIWDNGKKIGSRVFLKSDINLDFAGLSFLGGYKDASSKLYDYSLNTLYDLQAKDDNNKDGAFYIGTTIELYMGGTFPRTDLVWGIGSGFSFYFPAYAVTKSAVTFNEKFKFFATPSLLLAYDFFIPETKLKITPQLIAGFTCNPLIPNDLVDINNKYVKTEYYTLTPYSGAFFELSVLFSFMKLQWKK